MKCLFRTLMMIVFLLVLMAGISVVKIQYIDQFSALALFGFTSLILLMYCFAIGFRLIFKPRSINWSSGPVFLFLFLSLVADVLLENHQVSASKETAKPIIEAVENFHANHNSYPQTIDQLVPAYLRDIPRTKMGFGNKEYFLINYNDQFELGFRSYLTFGHSYDFKAKRWEVLPD